MNFNVSLKSVVDDSYDIEIGYGLGGALVSDLSAGLVGSRKRLAVITDDTVEKLYAGEIMQKLADAGFKPELFVIPSGEKSKTRQMLENSKLKMWKFSSRALFYILKYEKVTGNPRKSVYILCD